MNRKVCGDPDIQSDPCTVVHSVPEWLPQTQTWMYGLVKAMPGGVRSAILCEQTNNLDQFGLPNITALSKEHSLLFPLQTILRRARFFRQVPLFTSEVRKIGGHLVHSHFGVFGWRDAFAVHRMGIPHVVTFYGADLSRFPSQNPMWLKRYRALFKHCSRVLCEGPYMASRIRNMGCPAEKVIVQRIGVDLRGIPFSPRKWRGGEPLRVMIAAGFRPKKGIPDALAALARVSENIQLQVTIVGDAGNDPDSKKEKKRILAAVGTAGMQNCVKFLGFRKYSELIELSKQHHLFVQTSKRAADGDDEGGAPVSLIEMAASGMPIVATRHCDIPSVILEEESGHLADEGDIDGIERALRMWIDTPQSWEKMLRLGRAHVEECHDLRKQAKRLSELYRGLIS